MIRHKLVFIGAVAVAVAGLVACGPGEPLADGPGPLPERTGPLLNNFGNELFAQEQYDAAIQEYDRAQVEIPGNQEPLVNAGNALYRTEVFDEAEDKYSATLQLPGGALNQDTTYNLGNTYYKTDRFAESIEAYKSALRLDPGDLDAKHNLELALAQMQEQQQEAQTEQESEASEQGEEDEGEGEQTTPQEGAGAPREQPPESGAPSTAEEPQESAPQSPQTESITELTEEQARELLEALGNSTETLESNVQQMAFSQGEPPEKDW